VDLARHGVRLPASLAHGTFLRHDEARRAVLAGGVVGIEVVVVHAVTDPQVPHNATSRPCIGAKQSGTILASGVVAVGQEAVAVVQAVIVATGEVPCTQRVFAVDEVAARLGTSWREAVRVFAAKQAIHVTV
jgi:hypothetical protein